MKSRLNCLLVRDQIELCKTITAEKRKIDEVNGEENEHDNKFQAKDETQEDDFSPSREDVDSPSREDTASPIILE